MPKVNSIRRRAVGGSGGGDGSAGSKVTSAAKGTAPQWGSGMAVAAGCGLLFGTAIHKSGVMDATVLRGQFDFSDFTMLKTFLAATGTSITTLSFMHAVPALKVYADSTEQSYRVAVGVPATIVGGLLLGLGMIWVQLGSGSVGALVTMAGGLTAGAVHGVMAESLAPFTSASPVPKNKASMADSLSASSRPWLGFGIAGALLAGVAVLDRAVPSGLPLVPQLADKFWNPLTCGAMIGSLQLPLSYFLNKNVGSASTMQTLASMLFVPTDKFPQLNKMKWGLHRWWQVLYLVTAAGTAAVWVASGSNSISTDVNATHAFLGGFVAIFGSRIAGGCTSGHGISGAGHLMWRSWAAVCAMFAGAIAAKAVLKL